MLNLTDSKLVPSTFVDSVLVFVVDVVLERDKVTYSYGSIAKSISE